MDPPNDQLFQIDNVVHYTRRGKERGMERERGREDGGRGEGEDIRERKCIAER